MVSTRIGTRGRFVASFAMLGPLALEACGQTGARPVPAQVTRTLVQEARQGRAISAQELAELREISGFAVAPDGTHVAFEVVERDVASNRVTLSWYLAPLAGGKAGIYLADGGAVQFAASADGYISGEINSPRVYWSLDGSALFFTRRQEGAVQIWRLVVATGALSQISHNDADVTEFSLSHNGHHLLYQVGRSRAAMAASDAEGSRRGFLVDDAWLGFEPLGGTRGGVVAAPVWPLCTSAPTFILEATRRPCEEQRWLVTLDGDDEHVTESSDKGNAERAMNSGEAAGFTASLRALARTDALYPDYQITAYARTKTVQPIYCAARACRGQFVKAIGWWHGELILSNRDGPGAESISAGSLDSIYAWNPSTQRVRAIVRDEGDLQPEFANRASRGCQLSGDELVCVRRGLTQPTQIVAIGLPDGAMRVVADPNPSFGSFATTRVERLVWHDPQGREIFGHLLFPADYQPVRRYPLVITLYAARGFLWENYVREYPAGLFAQHGMFVLAFDKPYNWRLFATTNDAAAVQADMERDTYVQRNDVAALSTLIDALSAQGLVDPLRVGITGFSTGATIVDQALVSTNRFAAASVGYSNTAPLNYYLAPRSYRAYSRTLHGGAPFEDGLRSWNSVALGLNASHVHTPLLINVADREYFDTVQNFVDLTDANRPVEMYVFPDEYHVKWQPAHHCSTYRRNLDWFRFWLQDYEDPDPAKVEQYVRWRELRKLRDAASRTS